MNTLTDIFSYVCGQGRCFVVDDAALPVCQRCLGLYVGAAGTGMWIILRGLWRRGFPPWPVFVGNVAALLAAMLGGLHVADFGPLWRLACGLWTGHVAVGWLVAGAAHLRAGRPRVPAFAPWRPADRLLGCLWPPLLGALAWGFGPLLAFGRAFWTAAAAGGAVVLAASILIALVVAVEYGLAVRKGPLPCR